MFTAGFLEAVSGKNMRSKDTSSNSLVRLQSIEEKEDEREDENEALDNSVEILFLSCMLLFEYFSCHIE